MDTENVHIDQIKAGDTIECPDGMVRTICQHNIKKGFCGISLWGDSYRAGLLHVKRVVFPKFQKTAA